LAGASAGGDAFGFRWYGLGDAFGTAAFGDAFGARFV
jgi:hypothetical protein